MRLDDLKTFLSVCSAGSLTAVANQLGVSKSTVARRVDRLESECGVPLLHREASGVRPTHEGLEVCARAERILYEVAGLRREVGNKPEVLRVIASPSLAQTDALIGLVASYSQRHPRVQVDLESSARRVDLATQGVDVALRMHLSPLRGAPSLMTRRLGSLRGHVYAAPSVIRGGRFEHPRQLAQLPVITTAAGLLRNHWPLEHPTHGSMEVPVRPKFRLSDLVLVRDAAVAGHGAALLPPFLVQDAERDGALVRLLGGWSTPVVRISVLWTASDPLPDRVRAFLDQLSRIRPAWQVAEPG